MPPERLRETRFCIAMRLRQQSRARQHMHLQRGIFDFLIGTGTDLMKFGSFGQSPLCLVLRCGVAVCDIQRLLTLGASLNVCKNHASPFLCATDFNISEFQIRHTFPASLFEKPLKTSLTTSVFEFLRDAGAPSDCMDNRGNTPLQKVLRCWNYPTQAVQLLMDLPGVDFRARDQRLRNLLHLAAENRHSKQSTVKVLIERGDKVDELNEMGETPLVTAIDRGNIDVARFLLQLGSPVNELNVIRETPLITAIDRGNIDLCRLIKELTHPVNGVRLPLHYAIARCRGFDFIQLLLFAGAIISFDLNPLFFCLCSFSLS